MTTRRCEGIPVTLSFLLDQELRSRIIDLAAVAGDGEELETCDLAGKYGLSQKQAYALFSGSAADALKQLRALDKKAFPQPDAADLAPLLSRIQKGLDRHQSADFENSFEQWREGRRGKEGEFLKRVEGRLGEVLKWCDALEGNLKKSLSIGSKSIEEFGKWYDQRLKTIEGILEKKGPVEQEQTVNHINRVAEELLSSIRDLTLSTQMDELSSRIRGLELQAALTALALQQNIEADGDELEQRIYVEINGMRGEELTKALNDGTRIIERIYTPVAMGEYEAIADTIDTQLGPAIERLKNGMPFVFEEVEKRGWQRYAEWVEAFGEVAKLWEDGQKVIAAAATSLIEGWKKGGAAVWEASFKEKLDSAKQKIDRAIRDLQGIQEL